MVRKKRRTPRRLTPRVEMDKLIADIEKQYAKLRRAMARLEAGRRKLAALNRKYSRQPNGTPV
jgi:hypothetical protein